LLPYGRRKNNYPYQRTGGEKEPGRKGPDIAAMTGKKHPVHRKRSFRVQEKKAGERKKGIRGTDRVNPLRSRGGGKRRPPRTGEGRGEKRRRTCASQGEKELLTKVERKGVNLCDVLWEEG